MKLSDPRRRLPPRLVLGCALALNGTSTSRTSRAAPAAPATPATPEARPAGGGVRDVEPPAETERVMAALRKAAAEAEANLTAVTAEHDKLDMDPAADGGAKADSARRLRAAILRAREAAALVRAAAVEPYIPAADRAAVRALPPAERLDALAARPAEEGLRLLVPEVKFERVGLSDVLDFLRDSAPINLQSDWRAIEAAGIDRNAEVNLRVKNLELGDVLAAVLRAVKGGDQLRVAPDDNVAVLTTPEGLAANEHLAKRLAAAAAADPKAKALLDRRLPEVKVDGVGLIDVTDFLSDVSGANVFADWKRLDDAGIDRNTLVSCRLNGVRLGQVLRLVVGALGKVKDQPLAAVSVEEGVILISTPETLDAMAAARKRLRALAAKDEQAKAFFAKRLPEVKFDQVGLKDVCDFLKDVTGTSIEVDWDALAAAGCPPDAPVSLRLRDVTTGEVFLRAMDAAAGDKGSPGVGFEGGHVVIGKPVEVSHK